ncbi:tetratricopeptide repeat protein [Nonlabens dokdonensis]|uniref:TPR repeat protein n=2 Tax=Nonlabens dokdonensis TaxID=328515 RepID=L7WEV2_NONDD|nr:tetratricopeptide repeat protein [Nonlabens dokdonensis]AGC78654.1 TPR repeat protein [Nonlabens dokdonensis DSW-6]PZX39219.1 tetratricopeptide repeat protein [Nonlabens dokdonensis]
MQFDLNNDGELSIQKFELMLKSNEVGFFDSDEFDQIIEHYLDEGKIALARKAIGLGISQHPTSVNLKLYRAEMFIFDNQFDEAENVLNELFEIEPNNAEIYIQKANIFSKTDRHSKSIELLKKALDLTHDQADVYNLIGMEFLFIEDYSNAKVNFMKCLELDDSDYSALYNIIYCFDFLNEHERAVDYLNLFLDRNPYSEVAWHQVGKQYFDLKMYEKSLAAFEFAIISDDHFVGAYLEKGKVLEKLGRYNEAIENYQITLKLDDPTSFAYLRLGKCFEKLGLDENAVKYFKQCVKEDPLLDKGWLSIVNYYTKRLDFQNALSYIEKATEIDADNALYWKKYASINKRLNFIEEAEYGYRRAIELGNYELSTWINRCDILIQLGEIEPAILNVENGLEFYPQEVELEYRLAGLHLKRGELIKGKFHLQNALKRDSEYIIILEEIFPAEYRLKDVQDLLKR